MIVIKEDAEVIEIAIVDQRKISMMRIIHRDVEALIVAQRILTTMLLIIKDLAAMIQA